MFLDSAHDGERNRELRLCCADDVEPERFDRRVFGLSRENGTEIDVIGILRLRFERLFDGVRGASEDEIGGDGACEFERHVVLSEMNAVGADGEGDVDMVVHDHEDAEFIAFSAEFFREDRELFSGKIFFAELNGFDAAVGGRREDVEHGASVREFVSDYEIEIGIAEAFRTLFSEIGHSKPPGQKKGAVESGSIP